MVRFALQGAGLVGAGAAGAAIAVGIVAAAGGLRGSTTVRELVTPSPEPPEASSFASAKKPLTIHEVYDRDAPGVVQVTATSRVAVQSDPFLDPFGFGGSTQETV